MTAATVRARHDGAASFPAANACMAGYLEIPRPLRLILTAGWNLTESVGLPVAAYVAPAWLDGRNAGQIAWHQAGYEQEPQQAAQRAGHRLHRPGGAQPRPGEQEAGHIRRCQSPQVEPAAGQTRG